jgi:hypothetical protein
MFLRAMAWKELREQRLQVLLLTVLGLVILSVVFPMLGDRSSDSLTNAVMASIVFAWAGGMVTGAVTLANERETDAQTFLDMQPRWRMQVWWAKLFVAVMLVVCQSLALSTAALAMNHGPLPFGRFAGSVTMIALLSGLYGLGCGMCGSAFARTVLAAIGWAIVTLVATSLIAAVAVWFLIALVELVAKVPGDNGPSVSVLAWALIIPLPLTYSALIYAKIDRQRRFIERLALRPRLRLAPSGLGLRSTLWLSLRQGWPLATGLLLVAVFAGPLFVAEPLAAWPIVTLIVGVLMGVATLGDEQYYAAFRFLADQRLPLGRLWLFKVGSRFLMTFMLIAAYVGIAAASFAIAREISGHLPHFDDRPQQLILQQIITHDGFSRSLTHSLNVVLALGLWGFYGFAFGHFAAMLARKSIVALAIALMGSGIGLVFWLPSMVSGGLPAWELLTLPVALLILARCSVWAWATDRLLTRRWLLIWGTAAAAGVAFIAACLAFRTFEVPSAAAPFDVAAFEATFPSRDKSPVRAKLLPAEERFETLYRTHAVELAPPLSNQHVDYATWGHLTGDRVALTLIHGWPKDDAAERQMAELLTENDWLTEFAAAAAQPPIPVDLPGDESLTRMTVSRRAAALGPWVAFRALYLQSLGRHAEALDLLVADLAVARRLMMNATRSAYQSGLSVENSALHGLHRWCERPGVPPELLERGLKETRRHEDERPPYAGVIKAEYLRLRDYQTGAADVLPSEGPKDDDDWKRFLLQTAVRMPWERARRERLLNNCFELQVRAAELDYPALQERLTQTYSRPDILFASYAAPSDPEQLAHCRHLADLIATDLVFQRMFFVSFDQDSARFMGLCRARGLQLRLALLLFQHRHGRHAKDLAELVPDLLPAVPVDPFAERPFKYRLINAEQWVFWREDVRFAEAEDWAAEGPMRPMGPMGRGVAGASRRAIDSFDSIASYRRLRAGTALVWSVGPDGADDSGRTQYVNDVPGRRVYLGVARGADVLFPVSAVRAGQ